MDALASYAAWWLAWIVRASLQASVVIALVLAGHWLLGRWLPARWRYAMWLLVLARLAMPTAPEAPWSVFNAGGLGSGLERAAARRLKGPASAAATGSTESPLSLSVAFGPPGASGGARIAAGEAPARPTGAAAVVLVALVVVWAAGAGALVARLIASNLRFHRRARRSAVAPSARAIALLGRCRREMGVRRPPEAAETDAVDCPALFGLLRPRLLLPTGLAARLSDAELCDVYRHELAHLKRLDVPADWLALVLAALHWFNPLVWLALGRMRGDRELACDELVLGRAGTAGRAAYGQTVLRLLAEQVRPARPGGLVGVAEGARQVRRRIRMIAAFRPNRRWPSVLGAAALLVLAAGGLTNAPGSEPAPLHLGAGPAPATSPAPPVPRRLPEPPPPSAEQPAELVVQVYDIRALLEIALGFPPPTPGAVPAPTTAPSAADKERAREKRIDELVALIRREVAPGSWEPAGRGRITPMDGQLAVLQTKDNQDGIASLLVRLNRDAGTQVLIEARFVTAAPAMFGVAGAEWQPLARPGEEAPPTDAAASPPGGEAAPPGHAEWTIRRILPARCATLSDRQAAALLDRLRRDKRATLLTSPRLTMFAGQWAYVMIATDRPYLADYAAKRGPDGKTTYEPQTATVFEGMTLTVRASPSEDRTYISLDVEPSLSRVLGMDESPYCGPDGTVTKLKVEWPALATKRVRTTVSIPNGSTLALRGLPAGWGEPKGPRDDREVLVLVKATVIERPGATGPSDPPR